LALPALRTRLEFLFALLSATGGVVLASGQGTEGIALIAIFCAAFGFIFVDWLRWFELPPIGAYLAMGGAAAYCVHEFWGLQRRGDPQMVSVALLLVLVQGVLMMQHKSQRILEQLAVFCLLELVVAAIFDDAINFGLLLIPIAVIGAAALSLLGLVTLLESIEVALDSQPRPVPKTRWGRLIQLMVGRADETREPNPIIATSSPESVVSIYAAATAWSRYAVLALSPAVMLIAAAFFYVLPRRIEPTRSNAIGPALVGFDDEIRLEQLGQVMQNSNTAMKIKLTDGRTKQPYRVQESFYLRGKVLEEYQVDYSATRPVAKWVSINPNSISRRSNLPSVYWTNDSVERNQFDEVQVEITCESMSRPALFAIAPYHSEGNADDVVHAIDRWTLSREYPDPPFPRISYAFGTHAFARGIQSAWIAQAPEVERAMTSNAFDLRGLFSRSNPATDNYSDLLTRIDPRGLPSVVSMARQVVEAIPPTDRTQARIARQMEQFLATDSRFSYTLKLDAQPIPDTDPVEQFLAVDRRGHCQYFASALALMLRSVGIPCRVVVGYRTFEYNGIGKYYIARQQHAHSWVEALIDADQIPKQLVIAGQRPASRYWMRLDPTPGISITDESDDGEGVDGILNLANDLWEEYVVEMDSERQSGDLVEATGLGEVQSSYKVFIESVQRKLSEIRAGRLGGGGLSLRGSLPLQPFLLIGGGLILFVLLRKVRLPQLLGRRTGKDQPSTTAPPALRFYAMTLKQLERLGIERTRDETPHELRRRAGAAFPSLDLLTDAFERCRYGHGVDPSGEALEAALTELTDAVDRAVAAEGRRR
jgi:hypothetical protein